MEPSTVPDPRGQSDLPVLPDPLSPDLKDLPAPPERLEMWVQQARQVQPGPPELLVPLGTQVLRVPPVPQGIPAQPVPPAQQDQLVLPDSQD